MNTAQQKGEEVEVNHCSLLRSQRDGAQDSPPEIILKDTYRKWRHQSRIQSSGRGKVGQQSKALLRSAGQLESKHYKDSGLMSESLF